MNNFSYDNQTGGPIHIRVPPDDNMERLVCNECGFINYINPKIVVGSVCTWKDMFLLCKRSINPRSGYWTIPAGYMEERESAIDGAKREAREEACAEIEINALLGVYSIPRLSQVQLIYRATLISPKIAAGPESQSVGLYTWEEIPWDNLAFPSVHWALNHHQQIGDAENFSPLSETELVT